jgi:hypothetical protein
VSTREKLLRRLLFGEKTGWRFEELQRAARIVGIESVPPRGGGSHWKFRAPGSPPVTVPRRAGYVLPIYVLKVRELAEEVLDGNA